MKQHILMALDEKLNDWEALAGKLTEAQISEPLLPSNWTVKDVLAHLMAWQQRSIARFEAALLNREPVFPDWGTSDDPDGEGSTDQVNAWIYETYREQPWAQVHQAWREGYRRLLELAGQVSERDLLASGKYSWMSGYHLALVLLGTYDHHQEHYEKLVAWLQEHGG